MPWYWTDDLCAALVAMKRLDQPVASDRPVVAIRRSEPTLAEAAAALQDEGELPLAA